MVIFYLVSVILKNSLSEIYSFCIIQKHK